MIKVQLIKEKIKSRLGELWWYTIILFMTQQLGSVINAVIGLWLVPKYVPQKELGVVLPLASIGSLLGLPLTILMIPFMKFLTKYMAQEEYGKVKALLRDVFILAVIIFIAVAGLAYFFMPFIFKRLRIENGYLPLLVICAGIMGALAPIFSTALQALKKFRMMSFLSFGGSIIRFFTLLIALPVRGLSGYFLGQIVPIGLGILASLFVLRRYIGKTVKVASYWREDWSPILKFTAWTAVLYSVSQVMGTTEGFVIRHRLSDVESAGYYMISRFAEISFYISSACTVVLFPLISEQHERGGGREHHLLVQSTVISFLSGLLFSVVALPFLRLIFQIKPDWNVYLMFSPHFFALCIIQVIRGSTHSFVLYHTAKNDFSFVPYYVFVLLCETVLLYCLTGYTFFAPWLPQGWLSTVAAFNPCRLSVVLGVILLHSVAILIYVVIAITKKVKARAL
jgi:O-antigen/teichoic acid export membrane protein